MGRLPSRRAALLTLACLLPAALGGCRVVTVPPPQTPELDFAGPPPDVVVLGVSGHCSPPCISPDDNHDNLGRTGALDDLASAIAAAGYRVQVAGYASHGPAQFTSPRVRPAQRGWLALRRDFVRLHEVWPSATPRVVLVGHSHGVPWTHQLARQFPQWPVAALIDIDGVCELWNLDHRAALLALPPAQRGTPDIAQACQPLPGAAWENGTRPGPKDLVPWNVERGLELHSVQGGYVPRPAGEFPVNVFWDRTPNRRPDGSTQGLRLGRSVLEGHSALADRGSRGLRWLTQELRQLAAEWRAEDSGPAGRPPAPR